jgi:ABC-type nitrate/sulfonate/bicarbonate transport system substrate-binding protein
VLGLGTLGAIALATAPLPSEAASATPDAGGSAGPAPVAHPNPLRPVRVIGFAGGFNLPIWAGLRQGFFAAEGLHIDLHFTPNSMYQITNLLADRYDIAMTAIDNVVAYQEGQNEAAIAPNPDLFAFFGSDNAFLSLVSQQRFAKVRDLKGQTLTVDAMTTGFAFVLREILARNGISENEVRFERAGGVASRFRAMLANPEHAATMQMTPFDILGEQRGLRTLVRASDVIGRYMGMCAVARRSWAAAHESTVVGFTKAYLRALRWLREPRNRPWVDALLVAHVEALAPQGASAVADVLLDERTGFRADVSFDMPGIRTVLSLRSKYGKPRRELVEASRYIDPRFRELALAALSGTKAPS